jgi:hypothetical protein
VAAGQKSHSSAGQHQHQQNKQQQELTQPWQQQLAQQHARLQELRPLTTLQPLQQQQQQEQQQGCEQMGHALLGVLNPLESVLWQQRQHSRALLDRALHALTSLQADVDTLLAAAHTGSSSSSQPGQPLLPLQHQQPQQQLQLQQEQPAASELLLLPQPPGQEVIQGGKHGQQDSTQHATWTIAAAWDGSGGAGNLSAQTRPSLLPQVQPAQQLGGSSAVDTSTAPAQAVAGSDAAGAGTANAAEAAASTPPTAAATAAGDADCDDNFEAELLQSEAAAPGRRLSEETLKQYTALMWHCSIDDTEAGAAAAAAAAGDAGGTASDATAPGATEPAAAAAVSSTSSRSQRPP